MKPAAFSRRAEGEAESKSSPPGRFASLIRRAVMFGVAILAILLLRLWWGHVADAELRYLADAAHARGEPFFPADFDPRPVPDSENAALSLRHAAGAIVIEAFKPIEDSTLGDPLTDANVRALDRVVAANQKTVELAHKAQSQTRADWQIRARTPVLSTYPPRAFLEGQRRVANVAGWAALREHAHGNDREAVERLLDLVHQSQMVDRAAPGIVCNLVSIGIIEMATNHMARIAPDLSVGDPSPTREGSPATRQQVRQLIAALLDEKEFFTGVKLAWYGARMEDLDTVLHMGDGVRDPLRQFWAIRPMFDLDEARIVRRQTQTARAAIAPNFPAARAASPVAEIGDGSELWRLSQELSNIIIPSTNRALLQEFRALTDRRAAATILAIRLYRLDHAGRYPPSLQELVPAYLPSVPADPMAAGGKALRYRPDATPPVIYSVGEDGIDNGGTSLPDDTLRGYRWNQPDAVYPLARQPAATQRSVETQDNQ